MEGNLEMTESPNSSKYEDLFFSSITDTYIHENKRFLRRDWLADEVAQRLDEPGCHFVLLTAEPGAGKSVFMAQLAHDHPKWPRYFIRRDQRESLSSAGVRSFLMRIGFQLADIYPEIFSKDIVNLDVEQDFGKIDDAGEALGVDIQELMASPFLKGILVKVKQSVERNQGSMTGIRIKRIIVEPELLSLEDLQSLALFTPANALKKQKPEARIVILIDALDELRYHDRKDNILQWLTNFPIGDLPDNVCFVLTSRPPDMSLKHFVDTKQQHVQSLYLEISKEPVAVSSSIQTHLAEDAVAYANKLAKEETLEQYWGKFGKDADIFAADAAQKSEGNLGYLDQIARALDHALTQIKQGEQAVQGEETIKALLNLKELPEDLKALYAFFLGRIWDDVQDEKLEESDQYAWPALYMRILSVLAVVQEPLTFRQIIALGKITASLSEFTLAFDRLRQFLDPIDGRFRFYHASLPEFLMSKYIKEELEWAIFSVDEVKTHRRIVDVYRLDNTWDRIDHYGQMHLPYHAKEAGLLEELTAEPEFWICCEPAAVRDSFENDPNLPNDTQAVAAIFTLAYPDLLNEEPRTRAAILHTNAIKQASETVSTFINPVLVQSPWQALWARTRSLAVPYRNRKTIERVKALTGAVVNDQLYIMTIEETGDPDKQQLSVWEPVEDTLRTTTVPKYTSPKLRVLKVGIEAYIEIRDASAGFESVILVTFEELAQIFTGQNFAIAIWKVDNSFYSIEVDFAGDVYLRRLDSPPFDPQKENLQEGISLERSPETLGETPIAQLDSRLNGLLPVATESAEPALVAVDIQNQLILLFPQSAHRETVFTNLSLGRGTLKLKEISLRGKPAFLVLSSAEHVLLVDLQGTILEKITRHDMEKLSSVLHQVDVSYIELDSCAYVLVANLHSEVLFWEMDARRFSHKYLFEQLKVIDSVKFQSHTFLLTGHNTSVKVWDAQQLIKNIDDGLFEEVLLVTAAELDGRAIVAVLAWVDTRKMMRLTVRELQTGDLLYEYERLDQQYRPHFLTLCQTKDGPCVVFQSNWWGNEIEFHRFTGKKEVFSANTESRYEIGSNDSLEQTSTSWWPEQFTNVNFTVKSLALTQINPSQALEAFVKEVFNRIPDQEEFWDGHPDRVSVDPVGRMLATVDYDFCNEQKTIVAQGLLFIKEQEKPTIVTLKECGYQIFAAIVYEGTYFAVAVDNTQSLVMWHAEPDSIMYNSVPKNMFQSDISKPILALGEVAGQLLLAVEQKNEVTVIPLSEGSIQDNFHIPERATALSFAPDNHLIVGTQDGILAFKLGCNLEDANG
jgi:hypothetical protein